MGVLLHGFTRFSLELFQLAMNIISKFYSYLDYKNNEPRLRLFIFLKI